MVMVVLVTRVSIPAMSTVGYGYGTDKESGRDVEFIGDHRPMRHLGEALRESEEPLEAVIEEDQVIRIGEL